MMRTFVDDRAFFANAYYFVLVRGKATEPGSRCRGQTNKPMWVWWILLTWFSVQTCKVCRHKIAAGVCRNTKYSDEFAPWERRNSKLA